MTCESLDQSLYKRYLNKHPKCGLVGTNRIGFELLHVQSHFDLLS